MAKEHTLVPATADYRLTDDRALGFAVDTRLSRIASDVMRIDRIRSVR